MPVLCRLLAVLIVSASFVQAQVITGTITDAETGAGLPAATVQIADTFSGTITNRDGRYALGVPDRPATIVVRFIGYEPTEVPVEAGQEHLDVALQPAAIVSPEVVVTGENPAINIMRRVIERKQVWQAGLETWRADAYARQVFGREPEGGDAAEIVGIVEGVTEAYWKRGEGVREIVKAQRQTENLPDFGALDAADAVINFYDDEIEFSGYDLMGPTSPDALDFYAFALASTHTRGDELVYTISMKPKNGLQPGFEGEVSVLGGEYALIDVALRPNASVRFPLVSRFGIDYGQQFASFTPEAGEAVWLPVDFRLTATAKLGMIGLSFPLAELRTVARLTNYAINVPVPDSLFEKGGRSVVDSVAVAEGEALEREGVIVPLEPREAEAYARLDSTDKISEAFRPSGALARFVDLEEEDEESDADSGGDKGFSLGLDLTPSLWFNRVEGLHVGGTASRRIVKRVTVRAGGGYSVEPEVFTYRGDVAVRLPLRERVEARAALGMRRTISPRVESAFHGRLINTVGLLAGGPDYFDYYEREGGWVEVGLELERFKTTLTLSGTAEQHRALPAATGFTAFGESTTPRPNPLIDQGDLRALGAELTIGSVPSGLEASVAGQRGLRLRVEASGPGLGSDYDYVRAEGELAWRVQTFLSRRLFPNTLDVRLSGGVHGGTLPLQRHFAIDGTVLGFAPTGVFRSLRGVPVEGDGYAAVAWEHDFRSVPFELLGLEALAVRNIGLLVHGAHGRTWLDASTSEPLALSVPLRTSSDWIHELGVSLSGGFFVPVRLDLTYRLDDPGVFVSFGVARLF